MKTIARDLYSIENKTLKKFNVVYPRKYYVKDIYQTRIPVDSKSNRKHTQMHKTICT